MQVRRATMDDAELLYEWANDADTRRWSFSSDPIPWESHVAWLEHALSEGMVLIGADESGPVGTVRFNPDREVSITVAPERRGCGLARPLLEAALDHTPGRVVAHVLLGNAASLRLFREWDDQGLVELQGQRVHRFVQDPP